MAWCRNVAIAGSCQWNDIRLSACAAGCPLKSDSHQFSASNEWAESDPGIIFRGKSTG